MSTITLTMKFRVRLLIGLLGLALATGCAHNQTLNKPASVPDNVQGNAHTTPQFRSSGVQNSEELLVVLTFSGGGTRAATLAYGVLQELRGAVIHHGGKTRRLIEEIDLISGVSGGSFTAAYYGLFGDQLFDEFETRFLTRDFQGELINRLFYPINWAQLISPYYDRSDLAADYFDRHLFHGATLANLYDNGPGPDVLINATDLSRGESFGFTPEELASICSDPASFSIARAVAPSAAVPLVASSITLRNFADRCNPASDNPYAGSTRRPYIHLLDGGLTDNLGLRSAMKAIRLKRGGKPGPALAKARKLIFIVVNAETRPDPVIDKQRRSPNLGIMMKSASDVPVNRYNQETLHLLQSRMRTWKRDALKTFCPKNPEQHCSDIDSYLIQVNFGSIANHNIRQQLFRLPTTLGLQENTVKGLKNTAIRLMLDSPDYTRLLKDIDGVSGHPDALTVNDSVQPLLDETPQQDDSPDP